MIRLLVAVLLLAGPAAAQAPRPPATPAPYPQLLPGQSLPNVPPPPGAAVPAQPAPPPAGATVAPAPVAPVAPEWLVLPTAEVRVLDKLSARVTTLALKTGEAAKHGPLTLTLRGCLVRPPDRAPDTAAYLEIADATGGPGFRGWMLLSNPALAGLESAGWDVRPVGCKP
jgi:hypothetical protein